MPQPSTDDRPIITNLNAKSPISEAYRALRTNIDFSAIDDALFSIVVTSVGPGEGKSTTVSNLAVTYAQAEKKVVIMDADLRKPTVHKTFNVSNRWGLTNVMSGQCQLDDVISETYIPNLYVITSGPIPPNPSEMLASKRMAAILEQLKERFDLAIIDTPPSLAVTDAQIMAAKCDGTLLVLDSGKVKREFALKVKTSLERVKARVIGVVLNNVDRKKMDAGYYYYYGSNE